MFSIAQKPKGPKPQPAEVAGKAVRCRYSTVALIGADGSGKSSVAKALLESSPLPLKYLYMGTSIESSNYALPTSRLVHKWKVYRHKKSLQQAGEEIPDEVNLHGVEHRHDKRGKLGGFGRLLRRVSEESYRQLVSWVFQLRGNVVLYDRHFLFDACPVPNDTGYHRFTDRLHNWFLKRLYPRPGLAIFLDAPAEVLYARKQEVPLEYLEREREKILHKREYAKTFVSVDTTMELEEVVTRINELLLDHCAK
jgi:thymidylate kinase